MLLAFSCDEKTTKVNLVLGYSQIAKKKVTCHSVTNLWKYLCIVNYSYV